MNSLTKIFRGSLSLSKLHSNQMHHFVALSPSNRFYSSNEEVCCLIR